MKLRTFIFTCLFFSLAIPASGASTTTYKWIDENGNTVYSQTPPKSGQYEVINTKSKSSPSSKYQRPTTPSTPAASTSAGTSSGSQQEASSGDLAAEEAKNAELRAKNCATAKSNLEKYTVYRRFTNEKGEVERMDDNVRAQKIQESKDAIKEFCD